MPSYQIYFFDSDGELLKAEEIQSRNDAEAIGGMQARMDGNRVELWRSSCKIEESDAMDSAIGWQVPKGASVVRTGERSLPLYRMIFAGLRALGNLPDPITIPGAGHSMDT
jgi:hypothetical protein